MVKRALAGMVSMVIASITLVAIVSASPETQNSGPSQTDTPPAARESTSTPTATPAPTPTQTPLPPYLGTLGWNTSIQSGVDRGRPSERGHFGFKHRGYGTITDRGFGFDQMYSVKHIRWDERSEELNFSVNRCLKPAYFESMTLTTTSYTGQSTTLTIGHDDIVETWESDSECGAHPTEEQEFEFSSPSNPFPTDSGVSVSLDLRAE